MTPRYAIFSTDGNPHYEGLWPVVSEICLKKTGMTPVLFDICDEDSDFTKDEFGIIRKIKRLENVPLHFQAQVSRMWGTKFFAHEVCVISDIDMIMMDKAYFVDQVEEYSDDAMVLYTSDAYDPARPECVGVHRDRYAICYNAAKGSTFDRLLHTNVTFQQYCDRIASRYQLLFDADELYFTECVKNCTEVELVMLRRGYYTKFQSPRRIERVSDQQFNFYDDDLLANGHYVDCHLARPYSKYKKEIDDLRDKILRKSEVYLIGAHVKCQRQEHYLRELVNKLHDAGKEFVICAHTPIPEDLVSKSLAFIYDSVNKTLKPWDVKNPNRYTINLGDFSIESPYVGHARGDYYHVGVLRNIANGLKYVKSLGRDVVHWIEYDALPDFEEDERNLARLENFDFIFYGIGAKFSFLASKINDGLAEATDEQLLRLLQRNGNVAEKVLCQELVNGTRRFIPVEDPSFFGRNSTHGEIGHDWSLYEEDDRLFIFTINHSESQKFMRINTNIGQTEIRMLPGHWNISQIGQPNDIKEICIDIDGSNLLDVRIMNSVIYDRLVKSVIKINH